MEPSTLAEVQALLNVTARSLASHCGLENDASDPDVRSEERRFADLRRQIGLIQRWPRHQAVAVYSEFSAQYLPALVALYKTYTTPYNIPMMTINSISDLPYFVRLQRTPVASDMVVLQATRIADAADGPSDLDIIAEQCQFLSTLLVLQGTTSIPEDVKKKLVPKLNMWRRRYNGQFAAETAGRCYEALRGARDMVEMSKLMKGTLEKPLNQCGAQGCCHRTDSADSELKQCSRQVTSLSSSTGTLMSLAGSLQVAAQRIRSNTGQSIKSRAILQLFDRPLV
ncbi:hypothetical protein JVU11DRAFT_6600 [Chiua virens]|nr:hypothetical protein JVU11DRAFT_6600 [Chiua virens]